MEEILEELASMRPEQKAPDNTDLRKLEEIFLKGASMRPEQKAPDNLSLVPGIVHARNRFNEAGAKSPG